MRGLTGLYDLPPLPTCDAGMATVYLADDLKHERKVALMILAYPRQGLLARGHPPAYHVGWCDFP